MISNEELQDLIDNPARYRGIDIDRLAKELLLLRGSSYSWIKCSDSMPECSYYQLFLVVTCGTCCFAYYSSKGVFLDEPYGLRVENITHWQPLPEPPKD